MSYQQHPVFDQLEIHMNGHVRYTYTREDVPYVVTKKGIIMRFYDKIYKKQLRIPNVELVTVVYHHLIEGPEDAPSIKYKDGNPHNTHITNLERITYPKLSSSRRGIENTIAFQARDMSVSGFTIAQIAEYFDLHPTQIARILKGTAHRASFRYLNQGKYELERTYRKQIKEYGSVFSEDAAISLGYYAVKIITERVKKEMQEEKQKLLNNFQ